MKKAAIVVALGATASVPLGDAVVMNAPELAPVEISIPQNPVARAEQKGNVVEARMPWRDTPGLTIKYDMGTPSVGERMRDKRDKQAIVESVTDFEGGFKVDVLLHSKPDTNRFCYQIEGYENYDFFYQPALTPEEIAEGAHRPEEIVGSFAVYHKTLKNHRVGGENYATGKVMHIPFPYVWSVNATSSTKQRAEDLTYSDGELCVVVQQEFLDSAEYPVRVDPTFGYTDAGVSSTSLADDVLFSFQQGSFPENGTLDSQSMHYNENSASLVRAAAYDEAEPTHSLIATTAEGNNQTPAGWQTLAYSGSPAVTAGNVRLVFATETGTQFEMSYDDVASGYGQANDSITWNYADGFPATATWNAHSADTRRHSIYATYQVAASETPAPTPAAIIFE